MSSECYLWWDGAAPAGVVRDWPEFCGWARLQDAPALRALAGDVPQEADRVEGEVATAVLEADAEVPVSVLQLLLAVLSRPEGVRRLGPDGPGEADWETPDSLAYRAAQITREQWDAWPPGRRRREALLLQACAVLGAAVDEGEIPEGARHRLLACLELMDDLPGA